MLGRGCAAVEPASFEVVPAVHLQKRRLVRPDGSHLDIQPVPKVRELAGKGMVCVVDFDGLRRNKADLGTLRKMAEKGNVWADAGSRFATDAMDLLIAGAERATLRWAALAGEKELREAHEVVEPGALLLGLEYRGAIVPSRQLGADEGKALALARELGLGIVVIDLARAGSKAGFDRSLASRFESTGLERWFAGGIRDSQDARDLEALGYKGCLVGSAMLEGSWA